MSRSLAVLIRFSKAVLAVVILISAFISVVVSAQFEIEDIAKQGRLIQEDATQRKLMGDDLITPQNMSRANAEAKELFNQLERTNPTLMDMKNIQKKKNQYAQASTLVFASLALGDSALKELLQLASDQPDTLVVFRGVPEAMSLAQGVLHIQTMARQYNPMPNIAINPNLFKAHSVLMVPTIVMIDPKGPGHVGTPETFNEVARVAGISDPAWLKKQYEQGSHGNLGNKGPVTDISEPDLIDVAKKKMSAIDWDEKKEQAKNNFWKKQKFVHLPRATLGRTKTIDPTIVIQKTIAAPDGTVIAKQGDRINPLHMRAFPQALVVFDPTDRIQIEIVKNKLTSLRSNPSIKRISLIATQLNTETGWDSYKSVTDEFDSEIFLLTPDVKSRFELTAVPSIVTATNEYFQVQELVTEE